MQTYRRVIPRRALNMVLAHLPQRNKPLSK
jgi:hypothetical protein